MDLRRRLMEIRLREVEFLPAAHRQRCRVLSDCNFSLFLQESHEMSWIFDRQAFFVASLTLRRTIASNESAPK